MTKPAYMRDDARLDIAKSLKRVLADTFVLYFKTHSFHWNVTGPKFFGLHNLLQTQYNELWMVTDEIAERIRALDVMAYDSMAQILKEASLHEIGQTPDAEGMMMQLAQDNLSIVASLQMAMEKAQEYGDEATADLMIGRINIHEKAAWMLRSYMG